MHDKLLSRATLCVFCTVGLHACAMIDRSAAPPELAPSDTMASPTPAVIQPAPAEEPRQAYLKGVLKRLPADSADDMNDAPREELYLWGNEICARLRAGKPADVSEYFGPALGAALVDSAKEVICPDLAAAKRIAL